ncbi:SRC kinase signaling inhibitor 1-like isoform X1 [Narcine bancroftii]
MSEAEVPIGFTRSNRFRQSLPLSRSTSQAKLRSPGVLFLQFGDETRRVHITHEVSSMETLHALIAHMFPQKLTMGMLKSPNTAILIKDETRNIFYELEDVRDIQDRSIIKIFRKDPIYAPYPASHIANGDLRREMVYTSRESSPTRRLSSVAPGSPHLVSASPTAGLQSSSPSRSRMSYSGGRPPSYTSSPVHHPERLGSLPSSQPVSPSPSAILERRDVKPDEDMSGKNMVLMKHESLYADPYNMMHDGRLSVASTQSLAGLQDPFSYPGGLYRRGSMRSLSTYSAAGLHGDLEDSFYKPSPQVYSDGYASGLGYRMAPSSPQKIPDSRMVDIQQGQSPHSPYSGPTSRSPPVRQSFRKDPATAVTNESAGTKSRNASSAVATDVLPGPMERTGGTERPISGYSSPHAVNDPETRNRMEAMEKQIASLTGLVQNALLRGNDAESASDKSESVNDSSGTGTLSPSVHGAVPSSATGTTSVSHPTAITRLQMQLHLHDLQQNASDLRTQLQQLRKLQLQSQDTMKHMMKRLESEISIRVSEALRRQEDPLHRQRALVEEERQKYLNEEEMIVQQLNDLEKAVDDLQRDAALSQRLISGQELEEKALVLRQLSETLTDLKAQFPSLQSRMRVILRVEVEAVKFLKEEPHRLDVLLKRCKTITDALATLRSFSPSVSAYPREVYPRRFSRQTNEMLTKGSEEPTGQSPKHTSTDVHSRGVEFEIPTSPPLNFQDMHTSSVKSWQTHNSALTQFSQNSPVHAPPSQNSVGLGQGAAGQDNSVDEAPVPSKRNADQTISVEAAERDWEEKRASLPAFGNKDINRLLEETQAELMKAIPDLGFAHKPKLVTVPAAEHKLAKPQHVQKAMAKADTNGRRHSEELTVHRYRTEKPSKSPPPPPPRRSFPSSHGLTTGRTGEVIVTSKKEATLKKSDSDETDTQRPHIKLRRTMSEAKPPSTPPPVVASAIRDDEDEEDRIMAELEVFQRSPVPVSGSRAVGQGLATLLTRDPRACRACPPSGGRKEMQAPRSPVAGHLPHIVLTEWKPGSICSYSSDIMEPILAGETARPLASADRLGRSVGNSEPTNGGMGASPAQSQQSGSIYEIWTSDVTAARVLEEFALLEASLPPDVQPQSDSPSLDQPLSEAQGKLLEISPSPPVEVSSNKVETDLNNGVENTETLIQALSGQEGPGSVYEKGGRTQSWHVPSSNEENLGSPLTPPGRHPEEKWVRVMLEEKPDVAAFEEPVDIKSTHKKLSTVFEDCSEEIQVEIQQVTTLTVPIGQAADPTMSPSISISEVVDSSFQSSSSDHMSPEDSNCEAGASSKETPGHSTPDSGTPKDTEWREGNSRDVRLCSPKEQPTMLSKTIESEREVGRKSLRVVVYEEEEKIDKVTGRKQTELKKLRINEIAQVRSGSVRDESSMAFARSQEIKNSTYKTMDSLEETIRELESTISQISQHPCTEFLFPTELSCEVDNASEATAFSPATEAQRGVVASDALCSADQQPPVASNNRKNTSPVSKVKPDLPPKPQWLPLDSKTGGRMPIPPAPKLKQQQSCEKLKHNKQREEFLKLQSSQQ